MSDRNVSHNSNISSPGQKPDQASPNPGGMKIHGDKMKPNPGGLGKPDQRNNQPQNPDRNHRPENRKP